MGSKLKALKALHFSMSNNFGDFQTTGFSIRFYTLFALKQFEPDFHPWNSDLSLMTSNKKGLVKMVLKS